MKFSDINIYANTLDIEEQSDQGLRLSFYLHHPMRFMLSDARVIKGTDLSILSSNSCWSLILAYFPVSVLE